MMRNYLPALFLMTFTLQAQDFPASPQQEALPDEAETEEASPLLEQVVTVTHRENLQASGCWATIYENVGLTGPRITLYDDVELRNLQLPDGSDWQGRVRSIQAGPDARVHLYGSANFVDREFSIAPGRSLQGTVSLPFTQVQSLRITCVSR
jgi:hypothetical protein